MWWEAKSTGPSYSLLYAVGDSPFGPIKRVGRVPKLDLAVGTGAGYHSVLQVPGTDKWYIVYRRRPPSDAEGNHRQVCIDVTHFDLVGLIQPVKSLIMG